MIPKKIFLTKGKGMHKHRLQSFELALRDAGIERCNLVHVSSIVPSQCKLISKSEGISCLNAGQITFCVLAVHRTKRENQRIGAAIGVAMPKEKTGHGYIAEYHQNNCSSDNLHRHVEDLAVRMFATTKGLKEDEHSIPLSAFRKTCDVSSVIEYVTQTKKDTWTTVLASAVFLM